MPKLFLKIITISLDLTKSSSPKTPCGRMFCTYFSFPMCHTDHQGGRPVGGASTVELPRQVGEVASREERWLSSRRGAFKQERWLSRRRGALKEERWLLRRRGGSQGGEVALRRRGTSTPECKSEVLGSNPAPPRHMANSVSPEVGCRLGWHSTMSTRTRAGQ
jgi:hypothetical protein